MKHDDKHPPQNPGSQGKSREDQAPHKHSQSPSHKPADTSSPGVLRVSINNWRESDLPFGEKLRVALRNEWIKLKKQQRCCGHPGEPGC